MNQQPERVGDESADRMIHTAEELAVFLSANRHLAAALVSELADEVEEDGHDPINDILEKGYEDSFYMDDLVGFDEEFEAIVITPMIEIGTDWDQPFDNHGFGTSVDGVLESEGVTEGLATEFRQRLVQECLRLVEARGRVRPDSGFVDIFGLKVYEAYKPLQGGVAGGIAVVAAGGGRGGLGLRQRRRVVQGCACKRNRKSGAADRRVDIGNHPGGRRGPGIQRADADDFVAGLLSHAHPVCHREEGSRSLVSLSDSVMVTGLPRFARNGCPGRTGYARGRFLICERP